MIKPQILIADDDRLVLVTLAKGLRQAGYNVHEASTGEEAIEFCREVNPDLAILDIRMPGMDGIEAARQLQEEYDTPFMIFSAYGENELVNQAVENGALGYLIKPLDIGQIVPAVEAALSRAKEIKTLQETETNLTTALSANRFTSIAVGIIMERYCLSSDDAFEKLRKYARSQRRKLAEVSEELVRASDILSL